VLRRRGSRLGIRILLHDLNFVIAIGSDLAEAAVRQVGVMDI